jgi:hypothetical protein
VIMSFVRLSPEIVYYSIKYKFYLL